MEKRNLLEFNYILPSPVGSLGLDVTKRGIQVLKYIPEINKPKTPRNGLAFEVYKQLKEYFNNQRIKFDLPLDTQGTDYQQKVWRELQKISYGRSLTYGDIAEQIRSGARAVGNACRNNPVSIIVPCHRVVSKTGLGGYSGSVVGDPVARKQWLLRHEQNSIQ